MRRYIPKDIEPKWQTKWAKDQIYRAIGFDDKPKFVMLTEFPYPSGDGLHMGHIREYSAGDIMARHKRMQGLNVLFPMAYDAFGLPAENYAIKNNIAPQISTDKNIKKYRKQYDSLGISFDWSRSFKTTDPDYYKWTQWIFLQFFKAGLAYQKEVLINWCPFCKTGLSNEEVINGRHERCDTLVEKKLLKQWLLEITKYADRLIDGLADVDFPSKIADQQINWIGRSVGAEIKFKVDGSDKTIEVFTTRTDTLYGATFIVLAPENPLVEDITTEEQKADVNSYAKSSQAKSEIERQDVNSEKTGVFTGAYARNPINNQSVPIWVGDYVLSNYGTGAIMAVPAHDKRDYTFAKKFNIEIVRVISDQPGGDDWNENEGIIVNSGKYNGLRSEDARETILKDLIAKNLASEKVNYRLRDWVFSRQRYWGEPIPIIHCPEHGAVPVPDDQLPVILPVVENYLPSENGQSPLASIKDWVNTTCPICDRPATRETDTMPNWAGSSWYYLRYYDPNNKKAFADRKKLDYWGAVDLYLGGMEHTTLHLLYSRFWHQFLFDQGLVPTPEPYMARRGQGIVLAADGTKMSKSKGNIVNPSEIIDNGYGADALRLAVVFLAPYDQTTPWSPESVAGTFRFLQRVWTIVHEFQGHKTKTHEPQSLALNTATHQAIKKVSQDLDNMGFNTAIAALMEYVNSLYKLKAQDDFASKNWGVALDTLVQLLAPFAPHMSEELWSISGHADSVHLSKWPKWDDKYLVSDSLTIVVQVNGKVRAELILDSKCSEDDVMKAAIANDKIKKLLEGKKITRSIYIPSKLLNLVIV
jgi:leucyl-tRNA synthetase